MNFADRYKVLLQKANRKVTNCIQVRRVHCDLDQVSTLYIIRFGNERQQLANDLSKTVRTAKAKIRLHRYTQLISTFTVIFVTGETQMNKFKILRAININP